MTTITGMEKVRYIASMEDPLNQANPSWSDDEYDEVWNKTIGEHFNNVDYRDYAWEPRGLISSSFGSFQNCNNLTTINFKTMTDLVKIGHSAFNNCGKLLNMSGNVSYVYKQYNASNNTSTEITGRTANTQNVLDLSDCSKLRSINKDAFANCGTIKYLHLPDNRNGASESTLHIGFDPEAPFNDNSKGAIISNTKATRILVGETALYAHHDFGKNNNAQNHYAANCFGTVGSGTNDNKVYYYCGNTDDIPSEDATSIKYWTKNGSGEYILFNNANDARTYFDNQ